MTVKDIISMDGYTLLSETDNTDITINSGFTSDLLSDVVANAPEDSVLITIQAHRNTIAVASLTGTKAVIFCCSRSADKALKDDAAREEVLLISTTDNQFQASCRIGKLLEQ